MIQNDLENNENEKLKKSLGYLQISTAIFHLSLTIIYWIIFIPISAVLEFLLTLFDIALDISFILVLVNLIIIFIMLINIFNLILGVIKVMDYFKNKNLEFLSKVIAILMLLIFPVGTISGWILLKNQDSIVSNNGIHPD